MVSRSSPLHRHEQTPDQGWQISGPWQSGLLTERSQCDHRLEWGLGPCDQGRPDSPIPHTHHTCGLFFGGVCRLGLTALSMGTGTSWSPVSTPCLSSSPTRSRLSKHTSHRDSMVAPQLGIAIPLPHCPRGKPDKIWACRCQVKLPGGKSWSDK